MSTFIESAVWGTAHPDTDILDEIDRWHDDKETTLKLHEYLGLSVVEYSAWMTYPAILQTIIDAHRWRVRR